MIVIMLDYRFNIESPLSETKRILDNLIEHAMLLNDVPRGSIQLWFSDSMRTFNYFKPILIGGYYSWKIVEPFHATPENKHEIPFDFLVTDYPKRAKKYRKYKCPTFLHT